MGLIDFIAIAVIVLVIGLAVLYIYRGKKRGQKCIGCPYAKQCSGKCGGGCGDAKKDDENI
jgi:hypothetical protein